MLKKIQTLAAARQLGIFEVDKLAQEAKVTVSTVHTVLKRLPPDWFTVETLSSGERGGQRKRFSLTEKGLAAIDLELKRLPRVEISDESDASRMARTSAAARNRLERAQDLATRTPRVSASLERLALEGSQMPRGGPFYEQMRRSLLSSEPIWSYSSHSTLLVDNNFMLGPGAQVSRGLQGPPQAPSYSNEYFGYSELSVVGSSAHISTRSRAFAVCALGEALTIWQMAKTVAKFLKVAGHFRHEQLQVEEPTQLDVATFLRGRRKSKHSQYDRVFLCVDSLVAPPDFEEELRNILVEASCIVAVLDVAYSKQLEALVVAGSGRYLARATEMDPIPWITDAFVELSPSIESDAFLTVENGEDPSQVSVVSHATDDIAGSGNLRALVADMVKGVSKGFEKKLNLVGVGYRAQAQGQKLNLQIGFSHPVTKNLPAGITVKTQSPTEILIKGADRRAVGQIAAEVRAARPPEPFRGRGVRHSDERAVSKKSKKK